MEIPMNRIATGLSLKALAIVDDASDEAAAVVTEQSIGGESPTRMIDNVCYHHGRSPVVRTDNG
jgi:hypothetical protein